MACKKDPIVEVDVEPYNGEPFPNLVAPIAYPVGPVALTTDSYSDTISVIDVAKGEKLDVRPVGRNPVDIDGPHHLALDAAHGFAYIALSYPDRGVAGPHASHGSSTVYGYVQKLRLSDLSVVGQVHVDPNPGDIVISQDGKRVVTSHFDLLRALEADGDYEKAKSTIAVVDPSRLELTDSKPADLVTTCVAPHGIALTKPSGSVAYVACYGEDKLAIVDLDDPAALPELIDVGSGVSGFGAPIYGPYAVRLTADESTAVISDTVAKDVRFFDTASKTFDASKTIVTLGAPFFTDFSDDETKLYIPTQQPNALLVVDLVGQEETVTRTFTDAECRLPHAVEVFDAGVLVVCEGDRETPGNVLLLDTDLQIVSNVEVGLYPDSITLMAEPAR